MANFTKINANTQRGQHIINLYNNSWATELSDVYPTHYSSAKASAYKDCVALMQQVGGRDLKITGACGNFFSVAFYFVKDGKFSLAYITHGGYYYIPLRDANDSDMLDADKWYDDFKNKYDGLCDTTKKHLANSCPHITSREQADAIMHISQVFDIMFRMDENKGSH